MIVYFDTSAFVPLLVAEPGSASMPPASQFSGIFFGDYSGLAVAGNTAYPLWADTRAVEPFLCPGTGAPGVPPRICAASAPNASVANDQEVFVAAVPLG